MAANDDVLIVGKLDSKELEKSINDLIDFVGDKTTIMAGKFDSAMDKMKSAMKDFAITQKVSVDLMKEAWKDMSASFDAMFKAQSEATGGGKGSGKATYPDNTIGALEQQIALEEKKRKEMELSSNELKDQNLLIEQQTEELKKQKSLNTWAEYRKAAKDQFGAINALSTDTIPKAQKKLQELINLQNRYRGTKAFDEKQWNRLEAAIDNVRAKLERLRKKGAVGSTGSTYDTLVDIKNLMPENSIDEITAKIKALRRVKTQDAMETRALSDEYQRLKRRQHELMGSSVQLTKSNNYLAQSFGYIRNRIVYALTLGAVTNFVKQIYEIRGQYELLERSLGVLLNSFERGSQVFSELNKMAIESPFTLMELATGAKQLSAYNFEAKEVVDTTRRLADISAALGVPMERLVYNLGQIRAQTRLTARDARDFANAGLPIVNALAERFSNLEGKIVTTGDVYDRMTKKMVSYNDVMAVINEMTDQGGKFFEFQAKQAETLRVQMANLTLAWNNMLNEMGEKNQGWLTAPVKLVKSMLQNWESVNRVLKNVVLSYGILKASQILALRGMTQMTWGMAAATVAGKKLTATIVGLGASLKALALNPWTYMFAAFFAITDIIGQLRANMQAIRELNSEIREDAQEAAENTNKFLTNKGNASTRELAKENKLTAEQGEKAWEQIRQQIEQSAMSSSNLIGKLLEIEDINERVKTGFDYAEAINKAAYALSQLDSHDVRITQDKGWFGMFGEGMVSDLKDYAEEVKSFKGDYMEFLKIINTSYGDNNPLKINYKEFQKELEYTANDIKNFLDVHKITDPFQINEILERVRAKIKEKNPEIKGEAARLFDLELDKQMAKLTNGAVDQNASLWAMFMERLKHNSSATFQGITNDWVKSSEKLSKEQQDAVDENLEYFKKSMPYAYDAVAKMVADASKLKIQIGIAFNVKSLSDFQKQVKDRINANAAVLDFGNETMWGTSEDNLESWVDARQKAIKALRDENKLYKKDDSEWSKEKIKKNNEIIEQNKNLLDLFHQSYEADKKSNKGSKKTDILGDALKKEVELIDNIQKRYKEYEKMGVDSQTAITKATEEYGNTLKSVNATLSKYGIKTKTSEELAGMDLRGVRDYLRTLLDYAKALGNAKGVEAIEKSLAKINVDITKADYKKITDGLNSELGKIKDEYELAIELDANPELGNMFANYMGINLEDLPKTAEEAAKKAQGYIDKILAENNSSEKIDISSLMDKKAFDSWVESSGHKLEDALVKAVSAFRSYLHKVNVDETKNQAQEWNKLLEKYAEYEYKVRHIQKEAEREREVARKKGASQDVFDAINNRERQEIARVGFEKFQKSPEWIAATGDLANMSKSAIGMLIEELERYKMTAKNLSPKEIKQLNNALSKLYKEQRKNNPFKAVSNMLDEAKWRMSIFDEEIEETQKQIDELSKKHKTNLIDGIADDDTQKKLKEAKERLGELKEERDDIGKIDASTWVSSINETISSVKSAIEVFDDLAKAISGVKNSDVDKVFSILDSAGKGASTGAAFGGYGAIIGGVVGAAAGVVNAFADVWSGNERINKSIEVSTQKVRALEREYKRLERAVDDAYGTDAIGAQRLMMLNKEVELAELERQLELEKSRKAKNKDQEKIDELSDKVEELRYEVNNAAREIISDLLEIGDAQDWANDFVKNMIDAFREGENYMESYEDTFNEMVDNMIAKTIAGKVIGERIEQMLEFIRDTAKARAEGDASVIAARDALDKLENERDVLYAFRKGGENVPEEVFDKINKEIADAQDRYAEVYTKAAVPTPEDIENVRDRVSSWKDDVKNEFDAYMDAFGVGFGSAKDSQQLSALQQGIQGVTEDTAGAIEAYMNGVSQQVYYQSDLLTQIRDAVVSFDLDVQVATMAQMLLQLQQSYQVQLAIQNILNGWSNPSGMAVRVEMV